METTRRGFLTTAAGAAAGAAAGQAHAAEAAHDHQDVPSDMALRAKSLESLLVEKGLVDPAALDALEGVRRELDLLGRAQHGRERRAGRRLRRARGRGAAGRREAGRQQRGIVLDRAHRTEVTRVGSTSVWSPTVRLGVPPATSTAETVPLVSVPSAPL